MESLPLSENNTDSYNTNRLSKDNSNSATGLATPGLPFGVSTKIIPDDRDLGDVARVWGANQKPEQTEETGADDSTSALPFDMDVPVAYSIPSSDVQHTLRRNAGGSGAVGESVAVTTTAKSQDSTDAASPTVRVNVDTRRIPCPRLCGASFGPGGLAVFANGQVQRMWSWYTSSASSSLNHHQTRPDEDFSGRRAIAPGEKRGLRTMNDLKNMMKAAKDAQWGEQSEGEASSVTSQQLGLGFFEDGESDDDSSESVGADSDDLGEVVDDKAKGLYETYFGDFRRPLTRADSRLARHSSSDGDSMGGPSSDMLAPVVKISRAFEKSAMHSQSRTLALNWELGNLPCVFSADEHSGSNDSAEEADPTSNSSNHSIPSALSPSRFREYNTFLGGPLTNARSHNSFLHQCFLVIVSSASRLLDVSNIRHLRRQSRTH